DLALEVVVEKTDADARLTRDVLEADFVEGMGLQEFGHRILEPLPGRLAATGRGPWRLGLHCIAAPLATHASDSCPQGRARRANVARSMFDPQRMTPTRLPDRRSRSGPASAAVAAAAAGSTANFRSANNRPIVRRNSSSLTLARPST